MKLQKKKQARCLLGMHSPEGYVSINMNRLDEILRNKRAEIERLRPCGAELHRRALERNEFRSFRSALRHGEGKIAIIAEIKKASPSAGIIVDSFDPVTIAKSYQHSGAAAISVLTDTRFFGGNLQYLTNVRDAISLPVLRKDFVLDEVQIAEAGAAGADAILLIVAALGQKQLMNLVSVAAKYRLDALIEVHTSEEVKRALDAGVQIVGINNRNLATFEVDLEVTERLSEEVPDDLVLVSESGIKSLPDVARVKACGVDAALVGEALMRGQISIEELRS